MANLVPFEPFREMMSLREAMNRLFEESVLRPGALLGEEPTGLNAPLDVYETDNSLVLKAAVPGMKPEDIEVTITGGVLTIKGEFKEEKQESDEKRTYLRQERRYGSFSRQLSLPADINADKVQATFEHGILTLDMPKAEAARPKSVKIVAKK